MRAVILGCGTSSGVPRIGNDWGDCDPSDPRNRRTRASILIESATTRILIDTGPDLREQLLASAIGAVDAVIWTHEHADHTHGIDDLRQVYHLRGSPVPAYARARCLESLEARFRYVFYGRYGYPPTAQPHVLPDILTIGDIEIRVVDQPHGGITSAGLRFEHGGRSTGYSTDFKGMTSEMRAMFEGVDLWILDALRREPHPTHADLTEALDAIEACRPKRAILTHMDQSMDYAVLAAELPAGIEPGYDGCVAELA